MFCKRVTVHLNKKDDIFHLRPLGDVHLGNIGCDVEKFKKNVEFVRKSKDYYTIGMGDFIDNVSAYAGGQVDRRWNPETVDREHMTSEEQIEWFLELWNPIKYKTWGLLAGNHEWKSINQKAFINQMCKPLGLPYLGRLAYIYLDCKYKEQSIWKYLILVLHGGYGGMQAGGGVNRMKAIGGDFDADLILMGHSHDTWSRTGIRISYDTKRNEAFEKKIIYCNTGTFLRGYAKGVDSYVEINPREAKRVGTVTITFSPFNRDMFAHD
jgi:hypothetical protein